MFFAVFCLSFIGVCCFMCFARRLLLVVGRVMFVACCLFLFCLVLDVACVLPLWLLSVVCCLVFAVDVWFLVVVCLLLFVL